MLKIEDEAMTLIDNIIKELPLKRIKSLVLNWDTVGSDYFPVLKCEFFEEGDEIGCEEEKLYMKIMK